MSSELRRRENAIDHSPTEMTAPNPEVPKAQDTTGRCQFVFVRHESEADAMAGRQRLKTKFLHIFRGICCRQPPEQQKEKADEDTGGKQFRLEATQRTKRRSFCLQIVDFITCCHFRPGAMGIQPNQKLAMSLHWMFRVNFMFLFAVMCGMFFTLVIFFAGLIASAGRLDAECVRVGDYEFAHEGTAFADAFALSWTTFSTVGYGSTYPALGNENDNPSNCVYITLICSLESFFGVLYSGFCGAILFGKVLRIQSHAQVIFSDPIVVRYGSGVQDPGKEQGDIENAKSDGIPCPILEFRVVNRLFNEAGGEIMDASLNVVANVDANDADPSLLDSERPRSLLNYPETGSLPSTMGGGSDVGSDSGRESSARSNASLFLSSRFFDPVSAIIQSTRRDHQAVDEDPTARLMNKRLFSKMFIEASDHPFFKRVWLARHILDETSPILKPRVRRQIRRHGGYWPRRLCSAEAVRNSLQFNQILVSLNGVSNVTASDVYAQKIYDFVDINIGYQFVNILYKDSEGELKVDTDLINDVREQNGGGGEPLILGG